MWLLSIVAAAAAAAAAAATFPPPAATTTPTTAATAASAAAAAAAAAAAQRCRCSRRLHNQQTFSRTRIYLDYSLVYWCAACVAFANTTFSTLLATEEGRDDGVWSRGTQQHKQSVRRKTFLFQQFPNPV